MDEKQVILKALHSFIEQRPNICKKDYTTMEQCNADRQQALKDLRFAQKVLEQIANAPNVTAQHIIDGLRQYHDGRLLWDGQVITYQVAQHWGLEYRKAVIDVCTKILNQIKN